MHKYLQIRSAQQIKELGLSKPGEAGLLSQKDLAWNQGVTRLGLIEKPNIRRVLNRAGYRAVLFMGDAN